MVVAFGKSLLEALHDIVDADDRIDGDECSEDYGVEHLLHIVVDGGLHGIDRVDADVGA